MLSDQILEPGSSSHPDDGYTRTCQQLKVEFPNSFIFYLEPQQVQEAQAQLQQQPPQSNSMFTVGDADNDQRSLNSDMSSLTIDDTSISYNTAATSQATDPLSAATLEYQQPTNSRFYNQLVNQRSELQKQQQQQQQQQNSSSVSSGVSGQNTAASTTTTSPSSANTREMFNDWIGSTQHAEHLKEISEAIAETIDFMLRYG